MACETWSEKLDTYLDGELSEKDERDLREHLRICASCAADALDRMQLKRSIKNAGQRFAPDPALRARIQRTASPSGRDRRVWRWPMVVAFAAAAIAIAAVLSATYLQSRSRDRQLVSELVDLHVATLASSNPVDIVSTDRHNVKPWFEGKLPFTFDLPDLEGTPFTLVGGRTSYLNQAIGAELIFRIRQHNISVFIFPEHALAASCAGIQSSSDRNFHLESWSKNDLCYFVVGDVNPEDLSKLAALLKS